MRSMLALVLSVAGCGTEPVVDPGPDGHDAGPADAGDDGGSIEDAGGPLLCPDGSEPSGAGCAEPDVVCPAEHPHPGGPCLAGLECDYPTGDAFDTVYHYRCIPAGVWDEWATCQTDEYGYPLCDLTPPLVESCETPFQGTLDGALVQIGPPGMTEPFRPFEPGERIDIDSGDQGAEMLSYRVRIACVDSAPGCVLLRTLVRIGDRQREATLSRVALHCGESLPIYAIVPSDCESAWVDLDIETEVSDVGAAAAHVAGFVGTNCG